MPKKKSSLRIGEKVKKKREFLRKMDAVAGRIRTGEKNSKNGRTRGGKGGKTGKSHRDQAGMLLRRGAKTFKTELNNGGSRSGPRK